VGRGPVSATMSSNVFGNRADKCRVSPGHPVDGKRAPPPGGRIVAGCTFATKRTLRPGVARLGDLDLKVRSVLAGRSAGITGEPGFPGVLPAPGERVTNGRVSSAHPIAVLNATFADRPSGWRAEKGVSRRASKCFPR